MTERSEVKGMKARVEEAGEGKKEKKKKRMHSGASISPIRHSTDPPGIIRAPPHPSSAYTSGFPHNPDRAITASAMTDRHGEPGLQSGFWAKSNRESLS